VALAEELPVTETLEAYRQLVHNLRIPLGMVFINRLHQASLTGSDLDHLHLTPGLSAAQRRLAEEVLQRAQETASQAEAQGRYRQRLQETLPLPMVYLPFLFSEEFGLPEVKRLSTLIQEELFRGSKPMPTAARKR
jgi:hypothetical protein